MFLKNWKTDDWNMIELSVWRMQTLALFLITFFVFRFSRKKRANEWNVGLRLFTVFLISFNIRGEDGILSTQSDYSTFQFFYRDISCFISVVFKALTLKLDTCNLLKKCMLNIKNHWNRANLMGSFFFAPIKWATSGLVRSTENWFQSKRYVVNILRENSQPKKTTFTTF